MTRLKQTAVPALINLPRVIVAGSLMFAFWLLFQTTWPVSAGIWGELDRSEWPKTDFSKYNIDLDAGVHFAFAWLAFRPNSVIYRNSQ